MDAKLTTMRNLTQKFEMKVIHNAIAFWYLG